MYRRLIADRPAFNEFFDEATALVREITTAHDIDLPIVKRQVHTLKGNCALFGIDSMATLCHAIEDRIDDSASLLDADRVRLSQAWTLATKMRAELVEAGDKHAIAVAREDYERLCDDLRRHADHESLLAAVESWELEPASKRLALIREQIERLASRLGRAPVDVICHPTTVRLPPRRWATFWSAFAHVVRNTVDHGVETSEKRIAERQARARHDPRRHRPRSRPRPDLDPGRRPRRRLAGDRAARARSRPARRHPRRAHRGAVHRRDIVARQRHRHVGAWRRPRRPARRRRQPGRRARALQRRRVGHAVPLLAAARRGRHRPARPRGHREARRPGCPARPGARTTPAT